MTVEHTFTSKWLEGDSKIVDSGALNHVSESEECFSTHHNLFHIFYILYTLHMLLRTYILYIYSIRAKPLLKMEIFMKLQCVNKVW